MTINVQLGAHSVPLKSPPSFLVRREIAMAVQTNAIRGLCAALGVCWAGKPLKVKYAYNPLPYGGDVFDELMALGIPEGDIYAAASKALELCVASPTEEGTARAEGFTDPTPVASMP
jgi:hypothetical protein